MPHVIGIHPSCIFVQSHQEDVFLLIGSVECEYTHHDEVCEGGVVKNHMPSHMVKQTVTLKYKTYLKYHTKIKNCYNLILPIRTCTKNHLCIKVYISGLVNQTPVDAMVAWSRTGWNVMTRKMLFSITQKSKHFSVPVVPHDGTGSRLK